MKKTLLKKLLVTLMVAVAMLVPIGCSLADKTANEFVEYDSGVSAVSVDVAYEEQEIWDESATADSAPAEGNESLETNRKLIKTVSMSVETENFQELIAKVECKVDELGGYIADAYTYNGSNYSSGKVIRHAEITLRIPEGKLDSLVGAVDGICNVVEKTTSTEDVTLQYVDTQGKKNMYLAEEQSLLALLEKADKLEDITHLTTRLSEVRYQIENTESRLRTYDNLVAYATVNLSVNEVEVLTEIIEEEKGFWQNLGERFVNSMKNVANFFVSLFEFVVVSLPYLVSIAIVVGAFVLAIKILIAIMKKKKQKKSVSAGDKE